MPSQATIYRFGPYELRPRTRELYKQGTKLRLRPQPFQVLKILVERAGDVVTREELLKLLWPAETFVDFEHGLNTSIKELRGVLSDSANEPRYIETLPRLGYRMIVFVEVDEPPPLKQAIAKPQTAAAEILAYKRISPGRKPQVLILRRWPVLLGISILLIAVLGAYFQRSRSPARAQPVSGRAACEGSNRAITDRCCGKPGRQKDLSRPHSAGAGFPAMAGPSWNFRCLDRSHGCLLSVVAFPSWPPAVEWTIDDGGSSL